MRLTAALFGRFDDADKWVAALKAKGYRAAGWLPDNGDGLLAGEFAAAARAADIVIGEICAWCSPISDDEGKRREAVAYCQRQLAVAERVQARCCVNVGGSRGEPFNGPHKDDLTDDTFDLIVQTVRQIIDAVKPKATFYTLETMPWMYPDSTKSCLRLIKAVDRKAFAIHYDPVNLINSPERYWSNGKGIREFCRKQGPHIRACHAKDILLQPKLTVHLDEVRPGLGNLDYRTFLRELDRLDGDIPVAVEHLGSEQEFDLGVDYIRCVAAEVGVRV